MHGQLTNGMREVGDTLSITHVVKKTAYISVVTYDIGGPQCGLHTNSIPNELYLGKIIFLKDFLFVNVYLNLAFVFSFFLIKSLIYYFSNHKLFYIVRGCVNLKILE